MVDIKGYEGLYAVTEDGQIYSCKRKMFLKQCIVAGYQVVSLSKSGQRKTHYVHRLVADAFLPNPDSLPEINHKNEIKTDNRVDNLEWCTNIYNMNYGTRTQRASETRKRHNKEKTLNKSVLSL